MAYLDYNYEIGGSELNQITESRGVSSFFNLILCTRPAIFDLKMLSNFRIKDGAGRSLLFAKKMHRRQLF